MKLSLPNALTTKVSHGALALQSRSPKILFAAGLVLMAGTVVSASRATLKLEGIFDDVRRDREDVLRLAMKDPEEYDDQRVQKMNIHITARGLGRVGKAYLPSVALAVAAVGCLTTSHNQLSRRNAGLSAALAATERALDAYRDRVREAYGEDRERELWRGEHETKTPVLDDEGRETKSMKKTKVGGGYSPYARIWGRDTTNEWDPEPAYNVAKLKSVQEYATMRLNSRGHLFLNEVYDDLGLERSPAGAVVGWKSKKYGGKDGYVDFGVLMPGSEVKFIDFMTGDEDHILLDFNCDGEIWREI